jgi:hypothetical protein
MFPSLYFNALVVVSFTLQSAILVRMLRTSLRRDLPVFFTYTVFCLLRSLLLTSLRNYYGYGSVAYFFAYWITMFGDATLAFFVIQEIYSSVLYRYDGLRTLSTAIFRWAFALLILLAVIAAFAAPAADSDRLMAIITMFDRSAMMVEVGLLALLFIFAKTLSLGWRECIFGIAFGMCLFCSLDLAALTARANFGDALGFYYAVFKSTAYVTTVVIWTVYVYRPERARNREIVPFHSDTLDQWNASVLQYLNR